MVHLCCDIAVFQDCIDGILTLSNPDRLIAGCVNISSVCVRVEFCKSWFLLLGVWEFKRMEACKQSSFDADIQQCLQLIPVFLLGFSGVGGLALISGPNITTFFVWLGRSI